MIGKRLGPYELLGKLGAGGMGEVYRARDTRLDRTVAIKVLTHDAAADQSFRERFEREAKAIAALNHPHICTLHDVGEHAGTSFLVMEHLEGETLAARIARGPLTPAEALPIAGQIAAALDRAHRAGIVHRDLKPANVMLVKGPMRAGATSSTVTAKLLDFGLARVGSALSGIGLDAANSPTLASGLTVQGTILGTLHYMSPEQIDGEEADARSDIFAFGVVLYEMLTGTRAFEGKTPASVFGSILRDQPPPVSALQPLATPALDHLVRTCLAKDREERVQSAHDLRLQLQWIAEHASTPLPPTAPDAAALSRSRLGGALPWAIAAATAVAAVVAVLWRPAVTVSEPARFEISAPAGTDWEPQNSVTVSPDGRQLLFAARPADGDETMLLLRTLSEATARPLPGTEGARVPFWSPDMRRAGFFAEGKLKTIDLASGTIQSLCDVVMSRVSAAWGATAIVFSSEIGRPLERVAPTGGPCTPLIQVQNDATPTRPAFLPDGRTLVYHRQRWAGDYEPEIMTASIDGGEPRLLVENASNPVPVGDRALLFVRDNILMVQPFDGLSLGGQPTPLALMGERADPSTRARASVGGATLVHPLAESARARLAWFDRSGRRLSWLGAADDQANPELAPDGQRVVISRFSGLRDGDVWLIDERGQERRLASEAREPLWSPDGSRIVYGSGEKWMTTDTDGSAAVDLRPSVGGNLTSWSPDGQHFLVQRLSATTNRDVVIVPVVTTTTAARDFAATGRNELQGQFSPDGRWIAYVAGEGDREREVYVADFPDRRRVVRVSPSGGLQPRWRADGRELFYLAPDLRLMAVPIQLAPTPTVGEPAPLFEVRTHRGYYAALGTRAQYAVAPDGQRFLVNVAQADLRRRFMVLLNWERLFE